MERIEQIWTTGNDAQPTFSRSRRLATHLLLWYARYVPYHRGKTRLSRYLRDVFGVALVGETVERRDGLWWTLDRGDYTSQDLYWSGANDRAELQHVLRLLPRGGVMVDVGANFGSYCITVAARLRGHCAIHAFEPHPRVFDRLRKNIALNGASAVNAYQEGLSDREETAGIVEMRGNSGATYLRPGRDVAVTTLDRFCERASIARLDLIKIDAEGAELRILRGGATTLARFRPVLLFELNASALERDAATRADVLALLHSSGYRVYAINPLREIVPDAAHFPSAVCNVLCLPRERFGAVS
jgi:FkbM family methyltransferase